MTAKTQAQEYSFRGFTVPDYMVGALRDYIENYVPVGGFLTAVLQNDLTEAVGRADDHNTANLPAYVSYLYNNAPRDCWGSPERVTAWLAKRKVAKT